MSATDTLQQQIAERYDASQSSILMEIEAEVLASRHERQAECLRELADLEAEAEKVAASNNAKIAKLEAKRDEAQAALKKANVELSREVLAHNGKMSTFDRRRHRLTTEAADLADPVIEEFITKARRESEVARHRDGEEFEKLRDAASEAEALKMNPDGGELIYKLASHVGIEL